MTTKEADVMDLAPEEMEKAYLEYRRACYDIVYRTCVDHDVFDLLKTPCTLEEFGAQMGVVASKLPVAQLLLDALLKYGALERTTDGRYAALRGGPPFIPLNEE